MRLRKIQHIRPCEISIAPLIDVVFLLIIFFMVVSQFTRVKLEAVSLPPASQGELPEEMSSRRVILNVHQDGRIINEGIEHDLLSLEQLLKMEKAEHGGGRLTILIRSDRKTSWKTVREIMQVCAGEGLSRVKVAVTEAEGQN
ncbi:MAG: biopolymer transporter ExbD [Phycisphaerae bacterium]|nr:biopolymer transporter ExbD [Phycisphaerae bacterium]